jgi:retron-type reverse transcriptase
MEFSRRLASNLDALHQELHSGSYRPKPYVEFTVYEPKQRIIYAPAFRDLVVQHAIYRLVYPIFNAGFIDQSFACRVGKGTHAAADYAQAALPLCGRLCDFWRNPRHMCQPPGAHPGLHC